jgi:tetratricopeptide (TPR) repeat protein
MNLGGLAESQRYLEEGSTLAQANGDRTMQCFTLFNLSRLAVWQGDDTRALSLAHAALNIAVAVEARNFEVSALVCLGDAELSLGRHAAAAAAFERAREGAQLINHLSQNEATAGLARVALSLGNVGDALRHVESLLVNLERGDALEVVHETLLELTCYKTLVRAGDARAVNWLERAHAHVQGAAVRIRDATLRQGFIANIPYHREIVETWSKAMTTKK